MIWKHWTRGGNVLTAFHENELPRYKAALEASGDGNVFIAHGPAVYHESPAGVFNGPVLCIRKLKQIGFNEGALADASAFWSAFRKLQ